MSVFSSKICEEKQKSDLIEAGNSVIIGDFRFIKPYDFTFVSGAKGRWIGHKLVDIFTKEFKHWTQKDIEGRIKNGKILVNDKQIPIDYKIKNGDTIKHTVCRVESPTLNQEIIMLGKTDDFIAYLKPASIPLHPAGGYFYNSMTKRLPETLHPVHRLDRETSGIIIMGRNANSARLFNSLLEADKISKTYVARVIGKFPEGQTICEAPIRNDYAKHKNVVADDGKPSKTIFKLISTNEKESIVEAKPITGRTHQIRVHLSHLGFPISNDTTYGGTKQEYTKAQRRALAEAKSKGLWPPDTVVDRENPYIEFEIYLRSIRYSSNIFDFKAPMPEWADLDKSSESSNKCNIA